ncbi:MAG: dTMP kinase [Chthonomonas sp.]|nr:dTMP kinase [Chthonomonas sp.]
MFVTFEGVDGAGKSTLIATLSGRLHASGASVLVTREPGDGEFGKEVRGLLLDRHVCPEAELFLFLADRSEHVRNTIRPALERGDIVLCDRYGDSTVVYQGFARGFDIAMLKELNAFATGNLVPDRTFVLDLDPSEATKRRTKGDRLDLETNEFHQKVRDGFLSLAREEPSRFVVLDAAVTTESLVDQVLNSWPT